LRSQPGTQVPGFFLPGLATGNPANRQRLHSALSGPERVGGVAPAHRNRLKKRQHCLKKKHFITLFSAAVKA